MPAKSKTRGSKMVDVAPVSCDVSLSGPGLAVDALTKALPTAWEPSSCEPWSSGALTGGCRVGHTAVLSPDQEVLVVAGGQVPPPSALSPAVVDSPNISMETTMQLCNGKLNGTASSANSPCTAAAPCAFVECYHLQRSQWFVPTGSQRRTAALEGGSVRWPAQASSTVIWELLPGSAPPPDVDLPPLAKPAECTTVPPSPTMEQLNEAALLTNTSTKKKERTTKRGAGRSGTPPLAPKPPGHAAPKAAAPVSKEPEVVAAPEPPAPPVPPPEKVEPLPAWLSASPANVVMIGGWDGTQRLASVLQYPTGCPPEKLTPDELLHTYTLPSVSELPLLPPMSHHTATVVRNKMYLFGGNTLQGCSNELYILESPHLQHAYEQQQMRLRESQSRGNHGLRGSMRNALTTTMKERSIVFPDALHGGTHQVPGWSCTRLQWPPPPPPALPEDEYSVAAADPSMLSITRPSTSMVSRPVVSHPPAAPVIVPAPAPRSSHSACCLYNRFIIVFGGRQLVLPDVSAPSGRGRANSRGPPPAAAAAAAKKAKAKPKKGQRPSSRGPIDEGPKPELVVLSDVAAFDCEEQAWVQVRVTGGEAPPARYAAAMCALPTEGMPPVLTKELLLHGGIGAEGEVLSDAWVLSATAAGGSGGKSTAPRPITEEDPRSKAQTLEVRWVRVRAVPVMEEELNGEVVAEVPLAATAPTGGDAAAADAQASAAVSRSHHVLVPTRGRAVYVVGGESASTLGGHPPPLVCMQLPNLTTAVEVPIVRAATNKRGGSASSKRSNK